MYKKLIILAFVLSCLSNAWVKAFAEDSRGTTGAQFLELPAGARAIAMGSAYSSINGDPFSAYYNPAGLTTCMDKTQIGLMHAVYLQSVSYEYGVLTTPISDMGVLGVSVQYFAVGNLVEVDQNGIFTGDSFAPNDLSLSAIYATQINTISVGGGVKYVKSHIRNSASTFAADMGLQAIVGQYTLGMSISNIGKGLKLIEETSPLPTTARIGGSVHLNPSWLISIDGIASRGSDPVVAVGTEYRLGFNTTTILSVRAGYNSRYVSSKLGVITGISAGAGLDLGNGSIDYSYSPFGDLGSAHRFSFTVKL